MQKIAIFLRDKVTNKLSLHVNEVNVQLAIERYGSVSEYVKYIYSECTRSSVVLIEFIEDLHISL